MNNYLDGYGRNEVTLAALDYVEKGKTVGLAENFTARVANNGENFVGVCTHKSNYSASILLKGYVKVSYSGDAPICGYNKLSANGNGGVKKDANGRDILVVEVNLDEMYCGIIL